MSIVRRWGILALGIVLSVVGVWLLLRPEPVGWFAYAPLSDTAFIPMTSTYIPGLIILAAGIALTAGWIGFRLARLPRRS